MPVNASRLATGPRALFAYGTLRFPEVLQVLLGRVPARTPAVAAGWRVAALPDVVYPGLVPGAGPAEGVVISDLTPREWRVIDAYEDGLYELRPLALDRGRRASAYVCHPGARVLAADWSAARFAAEQLASFVAGLAAE